MPVIQVTSWAPPAPFPPTPRPTVTDDAIAQAFSSALREMTPGVSNLRRSVRRTTAPVPSDRKTPSSGLSALLGAIGGRYRQPNWDGEEAAPITEETIALSQSFLDRVERLIAGRSIRPQVDLDVLPEPNGDIAVDWFIDHEHNISISVSNDSPGGVYYFAWRYDGNRRTGKSRANLGIPAELGQLILCFYE